MASYAVDITTAGQGFKFYGAVGTDNVSYEIDFESEVSPVSGNGYIFDGRSGASSLYLLINSSGKIQFDSSRFAGADIDGVPQSWTNLVTPFIGSGLDNIAGKTLRIYHSGPTLGGSYNGSFFIGSRYNSVDTAIMQVSGVRALVSGAPVSNYLMNEGSGSAFVDSLATYSDGVFVGYVDDSAWVSLGGGGPSTQALLVSSIVTSEAFGQPSVSFNALTLAMSAIASGEVFGQVSIDTSRTIAATGIPSLEAFGLGSINPGSVTVSTLGIASGEASGVISIAAGTYVRPVGIAASEAMGQPSVQALSVDILPVGIGSLEAFGLPTVPREAATISATGIASSLLIGEPMILVGDVTVSVNSANAGETMGQPTVRLAQLFIRPEGIYSGMTFGRVVIVGGDFTYVSSDYAIVSPVISSVVQSVVTAIAA